MSTYIEEKKKEFIEKFTHQKFDGYHNPVPTPTGTSSTARYTTQMYGRDARNTQEVVDFFESALTDLLAKVREGAQKEVTYPDIMDYVKMVKDAEKGMKYDDMYQNGWEEYQKQLLGYLNTL